MIDILIYLRDEQYEAEIRTALEQKGFSQHFSTDPKRVLEICRQTFIDLILVWPANENAVTNLLESLRVHQLNGIPVIPIVNDKTKMNRISGLPVAEVILIPAPRQEFFAIIEGVLRKSDGHKKTAGNGQHSQGTLEENNLIDLIKKIEGQQKDAIVTISYDDHLGQIYFRQGKVIRCTFRSLDTLPALKKLAVIGEGVFHVQFTPVDLADSLDFSNMELIEELQNHLKDQKKISQNLPDLNTVLVAHDPKSKKYLDELEFRIISSCRDGRNLHDLLLVLNDDNLDILKAADTLIKEGFLAPMGEAISSTNLPGEKKGVSKMFKSLAGVFKKNKEEKTSRSEPHQQPTPAPEPVQSPERAQEESSSLFHEIKMVNRNSISKLQDFIEGLD